MGIMVDTPNAIVPKLCNRMNFAKDKNGNVIMTMFFVDGDEKKSHILIGRVVLDNAHASEVAKVLSKILE